MIRRHIGLRLIKVSEFAVVHRGFVKIYCAVAEVVSLLLVCLAVDVTR